MLIFHCFPPPAFTSNYFLGLWRKFKLYSKHTYKTRIFTPCFTENFNRKPRKTAKSNAKWTDCIIDVDSLVVSFWETHCPLLLNALVQSCMEDGGGHLLQVLTSRVPVAGVSALPSHSWTVICSPRANSHSLPTLALSLWFPGLCYLLFPCFGKP